MYVNFRSYDGIRTGSAALFAEIDRLRPARLVLDMRDNNGGDFTLFRETILPALRARPWLDRSGSLFAIVGRETFSAAMTNAADLRRCTHATLIGEPIGERPNSHQEVRFLTLPNSHLRLGVSTRYYRTVPGNPAAIVPDVHRPATWPMLARGEDDALAWVLAGGAPRASPQQPDRGSNCGP